MSKRNKIVFVICAVLLAVVIAIAVRTTLVNM